MEAIHMTKKQRRREGKVDKISSLPNQILAHIISFLSPRDAVRTAVLSKKWKNVWRRRVPAIMPSPRLPVRWADPPQYILLNVLSFSDLRTSVPCFRAVCRSWRCSLCVSEIVKVPPLDEPCHHPNLLACKANVPSNFRIPELEDHLSQCSIYTERYYLLTSTWDGGQAPWIVRVREYEPNKWKLLVPYNFDLKGSLIKTKQKLTADINLLDCGVEEICTSLYVLAFSQSVEVNASKKVVGGWDFQGDSYVFTVLIQLQAGSDSLILLRLDKKGEFKIDELDRFWIYDIAYYNKQFYIALGQGSWQIGIINPQIPSAHITYIAAPDVTRSIRNVWFLPSHDDLFLLVDTSAFGHVDTVRFSPNSLLTYVFKQHMWESVNSLGDNIFFIVRYATFSLPCASRKLPWKPGSVCFINQPNFGFSFGPKFMQEEHVFLRYSEYPLCFMVYNPEDPEKRVVPFVKLDPKNYTGVFYPPPPWVKWQPGNGAAVSFQELKFDVPKDDQENSDDAISDSDSDDYSDDSVLGTFYNDDD